MFLGLDNWFVTGYHEDLVPHKGSASAVCVDQIKKHLALSQTKQAKVLWGLLLESSTATGVVEQEQFCVPLSVILPLFPPSFLNVFFCFQNTPKQTRFSALPI